MKQSKIITTLLWLIVATVAVAIGISVKNNYQSKNEHISVTPKTNTVHRNLACAPRIQRKICVNHQNRYLWKT